MITATIAAALWAAIQDPQSNLAEIEDLRAAVEDLETQVWAPPAAQPLNVLNPRITVFGNAVVRVDDRTVPTPAGDVDDRFNLRETEFDFRAAVDPWADAVVIAAVEAEAPGVFEASIEEGYLALKKLPVLDAAPGGLRIDLGRFRPDFGRLNRIHTHDLPHTTRPLALREFLGEEGWVADGARAEFFLPTGLDNATLQTSAQIMNGGGIAVAGLDPVKRPSGGGRTHAFLDLGEGHDLDLGLSGWWGEQDTGADGRLLGADLTYRWKPFGGGERRSVLLGGEFYAARLDQGVGDPLEPHGGFAYAQVQCSRTTYLGARWDRTEALLDPDAQTSAASLWLTHYTTEFLRFRLGAERTRLGPDDHHDTVWLETNFIFGSHPVEPYWVNR